MPRMYVVYWNANPFIQETEGKSEKRMRDAMVYCTDYAKSHMHPTSPGPPGGFPGVVTGTLRRNITYEIESAPPRIIGRFGVLATEAEGKPLQYALYLETGTRKMAPRPWLTLTLDGALGEVRKILGVTA